MEFLPKAQIESAAERLLEAYFHSHGGQIRIPVPVEDILELHLGLSLDLDDLQPVLGVPDVLGALWIDRRAVFIDRSLEPGEHPQMEGRFHFSVGHEIGHWQLHRQYVTSTGGQAAMLADSRPEPTVICRTSEAREPIEWQADYFSSCFPMPRQCVLGVWSDRYGALEPIVYADVAGRNWARRPVRGGMKPIGLVLRNVIEQTFEPHAYLFETVTEYVRLRHRIHGMYVDKLDGRVDSDFYDRMASEWRETQRQCSREIERHQSADRSYLQERRGAHRYPEATV